MLQCSTLQYNVYSTMQHITVQYITVQCSAMQYITVQYSAIYRSTVQYNVVQCSAVQYNAVQYIAVHHGLARHPPWLCPQLLLDALLLSSSSGGVGIGSTHLVICSPGRSKP